MINIALREGVRMYMPVLGEDVGQSVTRQRAPCIYLERLTADNLTKPGSSDCQMNGRAKRCQVKSPLVVR